jgi:hypothetical protein
MPKLPALIRFRSVATVALVIGIAAGVWLGDFWKGFGRGKGLGLGPGAPATSPKGDQPASDTATATKLPIVKSPGNVVHVVIRDRSYFVIGEDEEKPATLEQVIEAVRNTSGDEDGVRLRVHRAGSSRPSAELALQDALQDAQIPESAAYWSPDIAP